MITSLCFLRMWLLPGIGGKKRGWEQANRDTICRRRSDMGLAKLESQIEKVQYSTSVRGRAEVG
jgi:hypothetical protein